MSSTTNTTIPSASTSSADQPATAICFFLDRSPPEIRNNVYGHSFPLPSASGVPLSEAHKYRPAGNLLLVNRQIRDEASGLAPLTDEAWWAATWSVDLDALVDVPAGEVLPELSQEDASWVREVEFTTNAFPLSLPVPESEGDEVEEAVFREPLTFTLTRVGEKGWQFSCAEFEANKISAQLVDGRYVALLCQFREKVERMLEVLSQYAQEGFQPWKDFVGVAAETLRDISGEAGERSAGISWQKAGRVFEEFGVWQVIHGGAEGGEGVELLAAALSMM